MTAIALGGRETNLLCSALRRLIQPVTQAAHDPLNSYVARGSKHDFEKYLALYMKLAGFFGVDRTRLKLNFHRRFLRLGFSPHARPAATSSSYFTKSAWGHCPFAAMIARPRPGNAIAKAGAGYSASHSVGSASSVSVASA